MGAEATNPSAIALHAELGGEGRCRRLGRCSKGPAGGKGLGTLVDQIRDEGISALPRVLGLWFDATQKHHGLLVDVEMLHDHHVLEVSRLGRAEDDGDVLSPRQRVQHGDLGQVTARRIGQLDGQAPAAVILGVAVRLLHPLEAPLVGTALDGGIEGGGVDLVLGPEVGLGHEPLGKDCGESYNEEKKSELIISLTLKIIV